MANNPPRPDASAVRVLCYGRDEPLPERVALRAGPLTAVLENGDLRYVTLGGEEIVRRVYVAIRDRNWGTVEPRFTHYHVEERDDGFAVHLRAECITGDIDFVWEGGYEGSADGVIACRMEGLARSTFLRNRIGWCVLHPMALAGTAAEVETPWGPHRGTFPERISPHQPFRDLEAIHHPTRAGGEVTIRFAGDLFEMEDQRNWTDASYKTYSTPLRIPYPVEVKSGERIVQAVTISVIGPVDRHETADEGVLRIAVGAAPIAHLPAIGIGVASHGKGLSQTELDRLNVLRPAHLRLTLDPVDEGWRDRLALAATQASELGAGIELEVIVGDAGEGIDEVVDRLVTTAVPVARLLVFPRTGWVTTETVAARAREARDRAGLGAPVGGGSRAYFTELNRATLPLDLLEVVGYTINPQVHAFDNASLIETLAAQGETVRCARAICGDRPLAIGPITLRPPFNPNATGPEPAPGPGELPAAVDHRQPTLFAAGWTVGSIASLAAAGADSLTYYETTGWRGVIERSDHPLRVGAFASRPGMAFPLYHVLADIADFAGGEVLPVETSDPLAVTALALRAGDRVRLIVANFGDETRTVAVTLPPLTDATIRRLDATTAERAADDPNAYRRELSAIEAGTGHIHVELGPVAVATIDGRVAGPATAETRSG